MRRNTLWLLPLLGLGLAFFVLGSGPNPGEQLYTQGAPGIVPCSSCHGVNGQGSGAAGFPRIAGLNADYIVAQLEAFKYGTRINPLMQGIAKAMSLSQMKAVAAYLASLPVPQVSKVQASPALLALGEQIVYHGIRKGYKTWVPRCTACHTEDLGGIGAVFPAIADQHASYIVAQLEAWQKGLRHNDPEGLMRAVAVQLTPKEVQAVADYLNNLPAPGGH
jgi:cytochrome c553